MLLRWLLRLGLVALVPQLLLKHIPQEPCRVQHRRLQRPTVSCVVVALATKVAWSASRPDDWPSQDAVPFRDCILQSTPNAQISMEPLCSQLLRHALIAPFRPCAVGDRSRFSANSRRTALSIWTLSSSCRTAREVVGLVPPLPGSSALAR